MKKIFLFLGLALLMVSCQITEKFYLADNGSVKYEQEINLSKMMSETMSKLGGGEEMDSLRAIGKFPIDTLVPMTKIYDLDVINDKPTPEEQKKWAKVLDKMDKTKIHVVMNDSLYKLTMITRTDGVQQLNHYFKKINKAFKKYIDSANNGKKGKGLMYSGLIGKLQFEKNGKTFKRISLRKAMPKSAPRDTTALGKLVDLPEGMLGLMKYKLEYHFPKPIKSTTAKGASFSLDRKTMYIETSIQEVNASPEKFNFEVVLE